MPTGISYFQEAVGRNQNKRPLSSSHQVDGKKLFAIKNIANYIHGICGKGKICADQPLKIVFESAGCLARAPSTAAPTIITAAKPRLQLGMRLLTSSSRAVEPSGVR